MIRKSKRFASKVKPIKVNVKVTHCFLREALMTKTLPNNFNKVAYLRPGMWSRSHGAVIFYLLRVEAGAKA